MTRPTIVCLCGSTKFRDAYTQATRDKTLAGEIVLSVGLFGHLEGLDTASDTKVMLDELHLRKIDLADYVYVVDVDGYVGESTRREVAYAREHGKRVEFLSKRED